MNYQNRRLAPPMEPTTAKYLLDFLHFTRDDEQFRFYKKVSCAGDHRWCAGARASIDGPKFVNFSRRYQSRRSSIIADPRLGSIARRF